MHASVRHVVQIRAVRVLRQPQRRPGSGAAGGPVRGDAEEGPKKFRPDREDIEREAGQSVG